jgi:hypothetical protein
LHQDAVDLRVGVQRADAIQHLRFPRRSPAAHTAQVDARVAAGLSLVAHIDAGGRVVADQDHGQARTAALLGQLRHPGLELCADARGQRLPSMIWAVISSLQQNLNAKAQSAQRTQRKDQEELASKEAA